MESIIVNINVTPKVLDLLTDKILEKGGKKLLIEIAKVAVEKVKEDAEVTYSVKEVAEITKQSGATIRRHIDSGYLRASKPGKSYIITEENLNNYKNGNY